MYNSRDDQLMSFVFREDEWFSVELPEYLFPRDGDVDASIVDMEAIQEVCEVCLQIASFHLYFDSCRAPGLLLQVTHLVCRS